MRNGVFVGLLALGIAILGLAGGPAQACSPMEPGPCTPIAAPDDGLLAPYRAACTGIFAIEEFAVTPLDDGAAWLLDRAAMSCDGRPICAPGACARVRASPDPTCSAASCWIRSEVPSDSVAAPGPDR